ncbi:MAG TPA: NAD(P)H-dependent oxidoreductase [Polyangia bacterium]|jgi:NAD(P)H-dependent FMN reductase|nr:NAD(P)H-dependent oxidoreductase [Polyangia bacterium]
MPQLHVVIASTRPGRAGLPIGTWFHDFAARDGRFNVTLVDLAAVGLPLIDEPAHPRLRKYEHAHTKAWSATVSAADAFVFVTPEYNYSAPPALLNALDYLFHEWHYKPVGFVSYGGVSGGIRSVQMTKMLVTSLRMMPLPEAVAIPMFSQHLKDGVFAGTEAHEKAGTVMLDELFRWASALGVLRGGGEGGTSPQPVRWRVDPG